MDDDNIVPHIINTLQNPELALRMATRRDLIETEEQTELQDETEMVASSEHAVLRDKTETVVSSKRTEVQETEEPSELTEQQDKIDGGDPEVRTNSCMCS